jgi:hypothetical protein
LAGRGDGQADIAFQAQPPPWPTADRAHRAAKLAGLDHETFLDRLSALGIPVADYAPEELDRELAAIG